MRAALPMPLAAPQCARAERARACATVTAVCTRRACVGSLCLRNRHRSVYAQNMHGLTLRPR
eukprot:9403495-Lingulodinium_polyedra.AAC.1